MKVFEHVFSPDVVDHMVKETNRYGEQYVENHMDYLKQHPRARAHDLVKKRITLAEMFKFLALVITMGIVNLTGIQHYWSTSWPFSSANFSQILSRDRFLLILKFLHLANNNDAVREDMTACSRLDGISTNWWEISRKCKMYNPDRELSIDESMTSYKGRLSSLQYTV